eukprot:4161276-Amphidinium_carterae.1
MNVVRALRDSQSLRDTWVHFQVEDFPRSPYGPMQLWRHYLSLLGIGFGNECTQLTARHEHTVDWLVSPLAQIAHFFRQVLRRKLLAQADYTRPKRLGGAVHTDLGVSTTLLRQPDYPHRGILVAIASDALWHERLKHLAFRTDSDLCRYCGLASENTEHVFHDCDHWQHLRLTDEIFLEFLRDASPAARLCGLCPCTASSHVRNTWSQYQNTLVSVWRARLDKERERDDRFHYDSDGFPEYPAPSPSNLALHGNIVISEIPPAPDVAGIPLEFVIPASIAQEGKAFGMPRA